LEELIMAKKKVYTPTDKEQRVAVDFIEGLIIMRYFNKDCAGNVCDPRPLEERLDEFIEKQTEKYHIEDDPFTSFPCTTKEYWQNIAKYNKQLMEDKYGY
jgi:hypothetical protein